MRSNVDENPLGYNLTTFIRMGNAYNFFSRAFIDWVVNDEKIKRFIHWEPFQTVYAPDEFIWAILQNLPGAPGGVSEPNSSNHARLITWHGGPKCRGPRFRHEICIYGLLDLPFLISSNFLFANKFDDDADDLVLQCLEILIRKSQMSQNV